MPTTTITTAGKGLKKFNFLEIATGRMTVKPQLEFNTNPKNLLYGGDLGVLYVVTVTLRSPVHGDDPTCR